MAFFLHVLTIGAMSLLPILGYNIIFGRAKVFHFGQEAFSLIAAYAFWSPIVLFDWPVLPAFLFAAALVALTALLFSYLSLTLEQDGLGVLTIAMHLMVMAVVLNSQPLTRGALGIPRIPRLFLPSSPQMFTLVAVGVAVLWVFFLWRLDRGPFGRGLTALSEHPWHAGSLGIERKKLHTIAFLLSGLGSLLSGILFPAYFYLLTPANYDFPIFIFFIMCVVAGGPGNVLSVTLTTIVLLFIREGLRLFDMPPDVLGPLRLMLFGIILFIAVWIRRDTLFPQERKV